MTDTPAAPNPPAENPVVSVVMPVFNVERYLERAVRSALEQEGPPLELVIVDDASTDGTLALARRLAEADPRVRVIAGEVNRASGACRNEGARAARGEWVAVLDADDAYRPGRLKRLVELAERENLDAVADLPLLYDLTAGELGATQLPADGRFERLTARMLLESAVEPGAKLNYGLLKPVYRQSLAAQGRWLYPEHARHGSDFLIYLDNLVDGIAYGLLHEAHYVFSTRIGEKSGAWSSGSVTPVNYRAIAANTREWAEKYRRAKPEVPGLPLEELLALLEARAKSCIELDRRYGWMTLRMGAWRRHAAWLRRDPRNALVIAGMGLEKVLGKLAPRRRAG